MQGGTAISEYVCELPIDGVMAESGYRLRVEEE